MKDGNDRSHTELSGVQYVFFFTHYSFRDTCVLTESHLIEAGHFYVTYKKFQLTMKLFQLSKHNKNEEMKKTISRSLQQIQTFQPEVILLYTNKENTELILQQVP